MVEEKTATGAVAQRPAGAVYDQAGLVFGRVNVPQFLDTDTVVLWVFAFIQLEVVDQALAQVTTTAFSEQGVLGAQFHARHVAVFLGTVTGHAHVAGDDAFYLAIFNDGFRSSKARVNLDTQLLGLFSQPAAQVAKTDDVVAMVVHVLGHKGIGDFRGFFLILEQENVITCHRRIKGRTLLFPVGEEFIQCAGFHHGTGKDMGADLRSFFNYTNGQFLLG